MKTFICCAIRLALCTSVILPSAISAQQSKKIVKPASVSAAQSYAQSIKGVDCGNVVARHKTVRALEPIVRSIAAGGKATIEKDEFETTPVFESRQTAHFTRLFGGSKKLVFAKKMDPVFYSIQYDADRGIMSIGRPFDKDYYHTQRGTRADEHSIQIFRDTLKRQTFVASNAYGATAQVEQSSKLRSAFLFPSVQLQGLQDEPSSPFEVRMDTEQARRFKAEPMMLVVATLRPPYLVQSFDRDKATFDYPYETRLTSYGLKVDLNCIVFATGGEEIYRITGQSATPNPVIK